MQPQRRLRAKSGSHHSLAWAALLVAASIAIAAYVDRLPRDPVASALAPGTIGAVDAPAVEAIVGTTVRVSGWALDPAGIRAVEIRLDGQPNLARYGAARDDVSKLKPGYPDSAAPGFDFEGDFGAIAPSRHELDVVAINGAGRQTLLAHKSLIPADAMSLWSDLLDARPSVAARAFGFLMMTSGVSLGGANEVDTAYQGYLSRTQQLGIAVPILYLRTTRGAAGDWVFDPDFDLSHKCGNRLVAEDSLNAVIRYAVAKKLPVHFILNGGVWADASCDTPEWDVNDYLEQDLYNCQWSQDNVIFPDDYQKNLPGSTASPQLARSLTYNVYATKVRAYKRRNLQAAARTISAFARAYPDLFVGVNLDSDTAMNPFFMNQEWFDYNPGMLEQFRQWLAGSGPYAGKPESGVPNLRAYRRKHPLTLADVNRIARQHWQSWDVVDPPRRFPGSPRDATMAGQSLIWDDPWYQEWESFRKHVVALHYDELSEWAHEAGIPKERIFSAQGFLAPDPGLKPFAIYLNSRGQNYDSAGISIEGAIPKAGHLGAIVYGASAENRARMESSHSLFAAFARMDPCLAIVETNMADLKAPTVQPDYLQSYRAFRDMFNFDAQQVSVMAWNGSNGLFAGQPGYVPYTAWRNTPAENAMRDFLVSHADVPPGARLWTFGVPLHGDDDGWRLERGSVRAGGGFLDLELDAGEAALLSPPDQVIRSARTDLLVLGLHDLRALAGVEVLARIDERSPWRTISAYSSAASLVKSASGLQVPLSWPAAWASKAAIAEQLKIKLKFRAGTRTARLDRIALYPAEARNAKQH